jgi:glc operon protein GlcG
MSMFELKKITQVTAVLAMAVFAASAAAQERPGYGTPVTTAQAKKIAAGVVAECLANKWNVAVAVVDTHGGLVYYERMEDTQTASFDIAIMKAKAAATYRRPTRAFVDAITKTGPATLSLPGVVASPGGVPLMVGGKVIGAVGVSGVTGDQDEQCSKAGAAAM